MRHIFIAVVLAVLLAMAIPASAEVSYLSGFSGPNLATGINDLGQIAGWCKDDGSGASANFIWQNGQIAKLADNGHISGINNSGTMVGYYFLPGSENPDPRACLFSLEGTRTILAGLEYCQSMATGLNDRGEIVGWYDPDFTGPRGFLWSDGILQDLGNIGQIQGINNSGVILAYDRPDGLYENPRSFLYSHGEKTYLWGFDCPNLATGINDNGQVVGWYNPDGMGARGFAWGNGVVKDLGQIAGNLTGINNEGIVVGYDNSIPGQYEYPLSFTTTVPEPSSLLGVLCGLPPLCALRKRYKV